MAQFERGLISERIKDVKRSLNKHQGGTRALRLPAEAGRLSSPLASIAAQRFRRFLYKEVRGYSSIGQGSAEAKGERCIIGITVL